MTARNQTKPEDLLAVVRRVVWFEPAEQVLSNPPRLLRYIMHYGTVNDVLVARRYYTDNDFRDALNRADAGSLDRKSWTYWNLLLNNNRERPYPTPRRRVV